MTLFDKVIETLSDEQIAEFTAAFSFFDKKGRGRLTTDEFTCALRMLGTVPGDDVIEKTVDDIDCDGTGEITLDQFLIAIALKIKESECKEQVVELFKAFDDDGNGSISVDELRQVMHGLVDKLTNEEVEGMVRQADTQGTGEIGYNDFLKLISAHGK